MKNKEYNYWEKTKDIIDQFIDIMTNYRQSGHPGGSRSKVHILLSTLLGGVMRWDIRNPGRTFNDRFILGAGHTAPLIYATLAVLNEAIRTQLKKTKDSKYKFQIPEQHILLWEDLVGFRRRSGLPGHIEMQGKTLFIKFNAGPSGHATPASAGIALALKRAGAGNVNVFLLEGEGGLTPGSTHETANSAWGLALNNLKILVDWNDYGIDGHKYSDILPGHPNDWFAPHGWYVTGTDKVENWEAIHNELKKLILYDNKEKIPCMCWVRSRKGRGYYKYDNASHGSPHPMNSELFWKTKADFKNKYGVEFVNFDGIAPKAPEALKKEFYDNLRVVIDVLKKDEELVNYLANKLVEIGESVPEDIPSFRLNNTNVFSDATIYDVKNYPDDLFMKPGEKAANRTALAKWGAWINSFGAKHYNRPIFLASSADLSASTNVSGFGDGYGNFKGYGWYERTGSEEGTLLPQTITEFTNAGISVGLAATNLSKNPYKEFNGFWSITSTYGSFSYLLYGMMRLFSQMAQDTDFKVGKVVWVAGHSGPETADDSRTHFGIFSPGVTQLFPNGKIINLHPWEYNEVPVLLGTALKTDIPIIALHLTRPPIDIPDRKVLGMPSHFESAKGAYIIRDIDRSLPHDGTFYVQGTSVMSELVKILPEIDKKGWNIKIVYISSTELFHLQGEKYKDTIVTEADKANSTIITTQSTKLMRDWVFNSLAVDYSGSSDWDDCWRTGGTLGEILDEAHLIAEHLLNTIRKFIEDKNTRLAILQNQISGSLKK